MSSWTAAIALVLPWIAGAAWLRSLWPEPPPGRWPVILGYGYLLGWVGVTLLLRLFDLFGLPLAPVPIMVILVLLTALAIHRISRQPRNVAAIDRRPESPAFPIWQSVLTGAILLWLSLRFMGLALEVWWQPLFPWDAWTTWTLRARVWADLSELAPFISPGAWLIDTTGRAYTIEAWHYPPTVSLIAAWPVLAFGTWNETLANLPWAGCFLALGLGFFGQARRWGATPLTAMVFVWLLMSLPLLNTHIALAGYADLWLATALGFAFMSFLLWMRDQELREGVLVILLLLACTLMKVEGLAWATLFIAAWLAAKLRGLWLLGLLAVAASIGVALLMSGGGAFELPWIGQFALRPDYIELPHLGRFDLVHIEAWEPVIRHLFIYDNWHLLCYLVLPAIGWGAAHAIRRETDASFRAGLAWVAAGLLALYILFFWTEAGIWAIQATSTNRVLLHFVPGFVFWIMTVWLLILVRRDRTIPLIEKETFATNRSLRQPSEALQPMDSR
ncbi:hypothetical protein [Thiocapsa marina]|uniref:Glycosyltransferase RgtA/B/C/D-like domain-containing protein n=1 Tax=Thiocapsa marina 5811 TaxID=768671 RepID=F9UIL2_9GAMM|nr:hypothetical protein [Thiocapsa marina]EGV15966.1 hypothetical protein ThimaDRAFT_4765 [Thiocapsa marina 5811]